MEMNIASMGCDLNPLGVTAIEFLIRADEARAARTKKELGLLVADDEDNLQVYKFVPKGALRARFVLRRCHAHAHSRARSLAYLPTLARSRTALPPVAGSESRKGNRLMPQAGFHVGERVFSFCRKRCKEQNQKVVSYCSFFGTAGGAVAAVVPCSVADYRRLTALREAMVPNVAHNGGCNPAMYRTKVRSSFLFLFFCAYSFLLWLIFFLLFVHLCRVSYEARRDRQRARRARVAPFAPQRAAPSGGERRRRRAPLAVALVRPHRAAQARPADEGAAGAEARPRGAELRPDRRLHAPRRPRHAPLLSDI